MTSRKSKNHLIGAHVSSAGGVFNAPLKAQEEGCEVFQFFTRSPQGGKAPELTKEIIAEFHRNVEAAKLVRWYTHAPYFVNTGTSEARNRVYTLEVLRGELERGTALGVTGMMFHPGSTGGREDRFEAYKEANKVMNEILDGYKGSCKFLIENAAGSGSVIGAGFTEVGILWKGLKNKAKAGICLDVQHAFASGYDWRTEAGLNAMLKEFDQLIGLEHLVVVHANDSMVEFNARRDRHQHIKEGNIGPAAFTRLVNHPKLKHVDFICETPEDKRREDVQFLQKIRKN